MDNRISHYSAYRKHCLYCYYVDENESSQKAATASSEGAVIKRTIFD